MVGIGNQYQFLIDIFGIGNQYQYQYQFLPRYQLSIPIPIQKRIGNIGSDVVGRKTYLRTDAYPNACFMAR